MNASIATQLNVLESAIVRIEEWTHVLFVVVKGIGARFVSKKILEKKEMEIECQLSNGSWTDGNLSDFSDRILKVETWYAERVKRQPITSVVGIEDFLLASPKNSLYYGDGDWYANIRAKRNSASVKFVEPKMMTSLGNWVSPEEWDEIEGNM